MRNHPIRKSIARRRIKHGETRVVVPPHLLSKVEMQAMHERRPIEIQQHTNDQKERDPEKRFRLLHEENHPSLTAPLDHATIRAMRSTVSTE
jgi:hypothetical protein